MVRRSWPTISDRTARSAEGCSSRSATRSRCGFTLIELVAVMVLIAILSLTVTPALSVLENARNASLANEVERRLGMARAYAMTTGMPAGLELDVNQQMLTLLHIETTGASPTPMPDITGSATSMALLRIETLAPGTSIEDVDLADSGSYDTLWFDFEGSPHLRAANGSFASWLTRDATITISGGHILTIRKTTGLIEQ